MFPIRRKSTGPSATELLEATRKEYVKTEALKTAKIDPGRPRIFSRNDSDQEDEDIEYSVAPSKTSLSRSRIRVAPLKSPDFSCFCLTSTPRIRPSNYKPLESPYGAFHRVEKPHWVTLCRAKSTPPRAQPRPPPPRPPKPQWLRNSSAIRTSNEPNNNNNNNNKPAATTATAQTQTPFSLLFQKPIPAPRLSKQNVIRRQTMPIPMSVVPLERRESCDPANISNEFDLLRVSTCSTAGNVIVTAKTIESLTTTPSTSRGTISSYGGRYRSNSNRETSLRNVNLSTNNFTSPDSDSGLHHSSVESLDNPFYTTERSSNHITPATNKFHGQNAPLFNHHNAVKLDLNERSPTAIHNDHRKPSVITSSAIADERSTSQSVELSLIGSEASVFTSITAAYHGSCSMDDLTKGSVSDCDGGNGLMLGVGTHRSGRLGAEPSLIEKNARVIKWIYSCRTAVA